MMDATLTGAPAAADPPLRPASPWPVFWVASVAIFLVSLDTTMLYSVFGALRAGFPAASAADMSWVLNAYTVLYAAMLIPAGGLADSHGRKRVFMLGVTLLVVAVGAIALAIVEADSSSWTRTQVLGTVGMGLIALVAFVVWARSARDPLIDLGLFRHRTYSAVNAATLTFGIAFAMMFFA